MTITAYGYELDDDELEIAPEDEDLPDVDPADIPDRNPADPDDPDWAQDDLDDSALEGMGAADTQIWQRAVPRIREKLLHHADNQVGYCLREIRIPNETAALALDAAESLAMADVKHRITDWDLVPRGTIGYFVGGGSIHGHVYENLGNAYAGTTDLPTGKWGKIKAKDLFERWGYERAYWSPEVNDNRVWAPRRVNQPKPEPTPDRDKYPRVHEEMKDLARIRNWHRDPAHRHPAVAAGITRALRELAAIPGID